MSLYLLGAESVGCSRVGDDVPAAGAIYTDTGTVLAVQQQLLARNITDAKGRPVKPDGVMGPNTAAAIKKMQKSLNAAQTGVIDEGVLAALSVTPQGPPLTPPTPPLPSEGRPAKGWSQPQPDAMGPAITPETQQESGGLLAKVKEIATTELVAGIPAWQVALGALGLLGMVTGFVIVLRRD